MRIALIAPPWFRVPPEGYGGIERVVYLLGQGLVELGHDVTVFGRRGRNSKLKTIDLVRGDWSSRLQSPEQSLLWLTYLTRVYRALHDYSFDVIHDHNEALGVAFAAQACPGVPRLTTLHGEIDSGLVSLMKELDGEMGLVAISQAQQRTAPGVRWSGMVHNAVETHAAVADPAAKGDYIIQLARINPDKGQHLAIEAARRLRRPLILAGKLDANAASRRYFREKIQRHLGRRVTWHRDLRGRAKWQLLAGARAMLFPLRWEEPFGLAMAEAMVVGTPVIAFPRGAVPELIEEGVTGFIARNVNEMVEAFGRIDEIDPVECARRSRERFSASVMATRYEQLYEQALAQDPEGAALPAPSVSAQSS